MGASLVKLFGLASVLALVALTGCTSTADPRLTDEVSVTVTNKTAGKVTMTFEPQFDFGSSPGSENVRTLELAAGEAKLVRLIRGEWEIISLPEDDIMNPDGDKSAKFKFWSDGNVIIDSLLLRFEPTGPVRKPIEVEESRDDPVRLRGTDDF